MKNRGFFTGRLVVVLFAAIFVAGCGVKSAPIQPSSSTNKKNVSKSIPGKTVNPRASKVFSRKKLTGAGKYDYRTYQPPQPATEIIIKHSPNAEN
ncbi:MAG: hypothetical protein CFH06_00434 [Alphaproteobacteria bacterium MarineAlpha3_Bin5]|nr:hypothetical protein [Magnetovibrio sp.]PPR79278.1 MAG: hypothetical protein CFH06_00434 [Alphaproteobacteria bacterium MarineAlpha3_Bin5]